MFLKRILEQRFVAKFHARVFNCKLEVYVLLLIRVSSNTLSINYKFIDNSTRYMLLVIAIKDY